MINKLKNIFIYNKKLERSLNNEISIDKLEDMKDKGAIIVDVRSPQEYKEGHIKNSISIPEYELKERAKKELNDKNQNIILYCSTGNRSRRAKKILEKMGYNKVFNLENGWQNY